MYISPSCSLKQNRHCHRRVYRHWRARFTSGHTVDFVHKPTVRNGTSVGCRCRVYLLQKSSDSNAEWKQNMSGNAHYGGGGNNSNNSSSSGSGGISGSGSRIVVVVAVVVVVVVIVVVVVVVVVVILIIQTITEQHNTGKTWNQGTVENCHNGRCTQTAECADVKVHSI